MTIVDNIILPDNLFTDTFCCDIASCKGACCIEGDAGAPLEEYEIGVLEDLMDGIRPFLTQEGLSVIEEKGVFDFDMDGHFVTPLVNEQECAFLYIDADGVAKCAIEKAWEEGKLTGLSDDDSFSKPISCHLYPIRMVDKANGFYELRYHKWDICFCARKKGKEVRSTVFGFLEIPLIRRFGADWYRNVRELKRL